MKADLSRIGGITRRDALLGGAAAGVVTGLATPAFAQTGNFDWQRYKGQAIEVSHVKNPRSEILQKYNKEFEDLTGITANVELVPEQQHRSKQIIEFTSGKPSFDVTTLSWHVSKRMFGKGRWLEDLRPYLIDASMTSPDFDPKDFAAGALLFGTQSDGRVDSLPMSLDYILLYYNKEMFEAKGVVVPKTFDDMVAAASTLTDVSNRKYGYVARGLRNANTYVWCSMMLGFGEDPVTANGDLNTSGPAAVASAELFTKLLRESGPAGAAGYNWAEAQAAFLQGTIGMWPDGNGFSTPLEDPTRSRVVGKVGYALFPAGPKRHSVGLTGDGIGIASASRKKDSAYFYVQWATSKLNQARFLQTGSGAGARNSLYTDGKILNDVKAPRAWVEAVQNSAPFGRPAFPNIMPVTEFRDVFGIALSNMLSGANASDELKKATEQFKPILEKSERG